jgi:hypothetical protein
MPDRSLIKAWVRTHLFRTWTALVTVIGLGGTYYYRPEWLTWWLRTTTGAIEWAAGVLPYPWGDRVEVPLRLLGASFWIQITLTIIIVRVLAWLIGAGCRHSWRRWHGRR